VAQSVPVTGSLHELVVIGVVCVRLPYEILITFGTGCGGGGWVRKQH
jgi:hypothetical protein